SIEPSHLGPEGCQVPNRRVILRVDKAIRQGDNDLLAQRGQQGLPVVVEFKAALLKYRSNNLLNIAYGDQPPLGFVHMVDQAVAGQLQEEGMPTREAPDTLDR